MEDNYIPKTPMFDGNEPGKPLTVKQAKANTKLYHCNRKENDVKAHYFSQDVVNKLLKEKGAVGIRVYYALNEEKDMEAFLVAVDGKGRNLFNEVRGDGKDMPSGRSGIVASNSPCPNHCPPPDNAL